tara:strand:+ start:2882 stop:3514 length:633 start_codon:yes stop_codon:yes gene_type:complete
MSRMEKWKTPSEYGGYDPVGHYVVMSTHRDDGIEGEENFKAATPILEAVARRALAIGKGAWWKTSDDPITWVWRAGDWACGWVEYLMVNKDAPQSVIATAEDILKQLEDYPILDEAESAVDRRQWEESRDDVKGLLEEGSVEVYDYPYTTEMVEALCEEVGRDIDCLGTTTSDWDWQVECLQLDIEEMLEERPLREREKREEMGQLSVSY